MLQSMGLQRVEQTEKLNSYNEDSLIMQKERVGRASGLVNMGRFMERAWKLSFSPHLA